MRKWLTVIVYVSCIIPAFIYRYDILAWLKADHYLLLSLLAATVLALFPVLPYKLIISLFGYAYGSLAGAIICWFATNLAAALVYGFVKYLYRDRSISYLKSITVLDKFTAAVQRRPFASVILARLAPVIPQMAVNIYAGAAGLPFWSYLAASAIGKIPGIALYAFLGGQLFEHPRSAAIAIILYAVILAVAGYSLRPRPSLRR
ncbi:VTT domain-containing protein [Paenibacillus sp. MMS20-IR301]|uniref:TVP38/TMEM64 family protein n=1 Tax=Paenibacillus sp. MMS20-IR301 TaxID=2895946 RepID=UPI0028F08533|nr:VTT domain-containing protein [Paenibacillus sp. MMS20-IR301]WNS44285.1 VTT domain-containing protein [Paenibacillus sp. MMS20-IR301]